MVVNKRMSILNIIVALVIFLSVYFFYYHWLNKANFSNYARGYDGEIKHAEENNNYTPINLTKQLNEDYSLILNNAYLGYKRIIISYTLISESGKIPSDFDSNEIADKCRISIDSEYYNTVEETLSLDVIDNYKLKGGLLLCESNYGTDFRFSENSIFNITFNNLMGINKDIDFEFHMNKPYFLKDQIDYSFKRKNKKYNIQSLELDSINTTLNFTKPVYFPDMGSYSGQSEVLCARKSSTS